MRVCFIFQKNSYIFIPGVHGVYLRAYVYSIKNTISYYTIFHDWLLLSTLLFLSCTFLFYPEYVSPSFIHTHTHTHSKRHNIVTIIQSRANRQRKGNTPCHHFSSSHFFQEWYVFYLFIVFQSNRCCVYFDSHSIVFLPKEKREREKERDKWKKRREKKNEKNW